MRLLVKTTLTPLLYYRTYNVVFSEYCSQQTDRFSNTVRPHHIPLRAHVNKMLYLLLFYYCTAHARNRYAVHVPL